ncbi:MAG: beta-lactamase family protein [Saprospiraceae bacterium]|nr:beta-lactamase family protein [Saprospiraceae bacterium]
MAYLARKINDCNLYVIVTLSIIVALLSSSRALCQSTDRLRTQLEKIIRYDTKISHDQIPGFLLGIIDEDTIFIEAFGHADADGTKELSTHSIFQLGGLTKTFTALLVQVMHDRDLIDLDKPINPYLPSSFRNPTLKDLTLRELLTHTSGLQTLPNNFGINQDPRNRYQAYTKDSLLSYYRDVSVPTKRRGKYLHAHTNYALCEVVLEASTGTPFDELIHEYILKPVDMSATSCRISLDSHPFTPGFDRARQAVEPWKFTSFTASEGLHSSMQDLCHFLRTMLNGEHQLCRSFQKLLPKHQKINRSRRTFIATGWHLMQHKRKDAIYLHSGKTNGHAASIHFVQDTKTGVVVLTNSPGKLDGLALLVLRMINHNWKR